MRASLPFCRLTMLVGLPLSAALLPACGAHTQRGQTLYQEGRHIEAAEVFELTESRLRAAPSEECACYGLYRGLNFLKLGDLRGARHWLKYADELERRHPGMLSDEERRLLSQGWQELEGRDHVGRLPRSGSGFAASETPAPDHTRAPGAERDPSIADQ
jgi:tetratricopeptide (TPR) repeat protein